MMANTSYFYLAAFLSISIVAVESTKCWGPDINENTPTQINNRTDTEVMPQPNDNKIPSFCQGKTLAVQCKDDQGEPFTGPKDATTSHYRVTHCDNQRGLFCEPYDNYQALNYTCPNFAIQVGCDCPTTHGTGSRSTRPASRQTTSPRTTKAATAAKGGNGGTSPGAPGGNGGNGGTSPGAPGGKGGNGGTSPGAPGEKLGYRGSTTGAPGSGGMEVKLNPVLHVLLLIAATARAM